MSLNCHFFDELLEGTNFSFDVYELLEGTTLASSCACTWHKAKVLDDHKAKEG